MLQSLSANANMDVNSSVALCHSISTSTVFNGVDSLSCRGLIDGIICKRRRGVATREMGDLVDHALNGSVARGNFVDAAARTDVTRS